MFSRAPRSRSARAHRDRLPPGGGAVPQPVDPRIALPAGHDRSPVGISVPLSPRVRGLPKHPLLSAPMSEMTYRPLGTSGLMVSTVGLGTNAVGARIDAAQTQAVVAAATAVGTTSFSTADTSGRGASEELLGK